MLVPFQMVAGAGFEPATFGLWARRAIRAAPPRNRLSVWRWFKDNVFVLIPTHFCWPTHVRCTTDTFFVRPLLTKGHRTFTLQRTKFKCWCLNEQPEFNQWHLPQTPINKNLWRFSDPKQYLWDPPTHLTDFSHYCPTVLLSSFPLRWEHTRDISLR